MTRLAFATFQNFPDIFDDDRLAADVLRARGMTVTPAVWDDPAVHWSRFDCVVIRSAWDYHHKAADYADWLRCRASDGTRLWNPPQAVLANLNKKYLVELADRGVEVVPTRYFAAGVVHPLRDVLAECGWDEVVVKPAISAGVHETWRTCLESADADQDRFDRSVRTSHLLVQPFMAEVASAGEWSLIFFSGKFSHAVLKRPAAGDFRVQHALGGHSIPADPTPALIQQAGDILARIDSPLLYARIDGVERAGRLVLMELEINEPYLFLGFSPDAAIRFAEAIEAVL